MWKARIAFYGTGGCLGWQYIFLYDCIKALQCPALKLYSNMCCSLTHSVAAFFSSLNIHSVDFASFQPIGTQHSQVFIL